MNESREQTYRLHPGEAIMPIPQAREKHLLCLIEDSKSRSLASARDDIVGGSVSIYDRSGRVSDGDRVKQQCV